MTPIGTINPLASQGLAGLDALRGSELRPTGLPGATHGAPPADGFGKLIDGLVSTVDAKQDAAQAITKKVLLGENDQLHQSVIAMQEASVAFSMMVEVRNKLVESYQELMRMQV